MKYEVLKRKLKSKFGHNSYKSDLQKEAAEAVYEGKDVYICMPSGYGKSLCFQLPMTAKENSFAIVFTPTVALAKNQVTYLMSKNILAYYWNSHTSARAKSYIKNDMMSNNPKMKLLYITPQQFLSSHFQFKFKQIKQNISYFVIVEADSLSPRSDKYRNDYKKINILRDKYPQIPIVLLTSTADKEVREDTLETLKIDNPLLCIMLVKNQTNETIQIEENFPLAEKEILIHQQMDELNHTGIQKSSWLLQQCELQKHLEINENKILHSKRKLNISKLNKEFPNKKFCQSAELTLQQLKILLYTSVESEVSTSSKSSNRVTLHTASDSKKLMVNDCNQNDCNYYFLFTINYSGYKELMGKEFCSDSNNRIKAEIQLKIIERILYKKQMEEIPENQCDTYLSAKAEVTSSSDETFYDGEINGSSDESPILFNDSS